MLFGSANSVISQLFLDFHRACLKYLCQIIRLHCRSVSHHSVMNDTNLQYVSEAWKQAASYPNKLTSSSSICKVDVPEFIKKIQRNKGKEIQIVRILVLLYTLMFDQGMLGQIPAGLNGNKHGKSLIDKLGMHRESTDTGQIGTQQSMKCM